MFTKNLFFIGALFCALLVLGSTETSAQVSAANVLKRASAIVDKLESQKAQVLFLQVDNIEKEKISTQTYTLEAGSTYAVVAIGDEERIQDIDLVVVDDEGEVAGKDTDEANVAIVKVKSKKTQAYKIGVKGYKMAKNDGFFAIVICRLD
ncbi:MAG TPA: hypothetical protein VGC97_06255 [Pyrinomonadaceae bacterium]|jgi:hypothetical protein